MSTQKLTIELISASFLGCLCDDENIALVCVRNSATLRDGEYCCSRFYLQLLMLLVDQECSFDVVLVQVVLGVCKERFWIWHPYRC